MCIVADKFETVHLICPHNRRRTPTHTSEQLLPVTYKCGKRNQILSRTLLQFSVFDSPNLKTPAHTDVLRSQPCTLHCHAFQAGAAGSALALINSFSSLTIIHSHRTVTPFRLVQQQQPPPWLQQQQQPGQSSGQQQNFNDGVTDSTRQLAQMLGSKVCG